MLLWCIATGCLGQYIEELLLCEEEVLPFLPADAKACLMAVARRQVWCLFTRELPFLVCVVLSRADPLLQCLLNNAALDMLVDSNWTSLDVSDSSVTDAALQAALQTTPHLLSLDLTGCVVSQKTVRSLGTWCPQLQVLRIGALRCSTAVLLLGHQCNLAIQ